MIELSVARNAASLLRKVLLLVPLAACSPAGLLNALAPSVVVTKGLAYGEGIRATADVYAPSASCVGAPVVVFFYGGGWEDGDRAMYRFVGAALASQGVVTVIPDYRLWPEIGFPGFMEDAAAALAWTRAHATRFGGDPNRLFIMGHSAGAQIATLLALDPRYLREVGMNPKSVTGVIGLSGPYDFLPLTSPTLQAIFGTEAEWPRSQPINFVTPQAPPMMLATGTGDTTVNPSNTTRLAARLRQTGVTVTEYQYPGLGHASTIGAFSGALSLLAPVRQEALDFIAGNGGSPCRE
jgi:acetyl esterase/lipase